MSHHIHFVPQFLPLERSLKPDKKRRIRKSRLGSVSYAADVDDAAEIDEVFAPSPVGGRATAQAEPQDDPGQPIRATLNRATMSTLLRAQEDS